MIWYMCSTGGGARSAGKDVVGIKGAIWEPISGNSCGICRARAVQRRPREERWSAAKVDEVKRARWKVGEEADGDIREGRNVDLGVGVFDMFLDRLLHPFHVWSIFAVKADPDLRVSCGQAVLEGTCRGARSIRDPRSIRASAHHPPQ